ncbi:MAG: bifunctional 5,10-methylenetetrahydrofolate dehydrogenase/5,10-methenyltetrahydrofolate cyclohydrolase [Deltaproteobacteria bacterium]|nr:bifunctional 5,10-methylenetetrahydrofolate dehydrogenase/5,10-methenyltetrahydrofolate cyclohydrolase [Deltaproteobacteria bacterium]
MTARIIDGKAIAESLQALLREEVAAFEASRGAAPVLAAVIVGDDPASRIYVRNKQRACRAAGIGTRLVELPADTSPSELLDRVDGLNRDPGVHGILVQAPLPGGLDELAVARRVSPLKDVDCFHPENLGLLAARRPRFLPCTPAGVLELLEHSGVPLEGARVTILGRSLIVGRPLAMMLTDRNATVTVCHTRTRDLPELCREAEILVAAAGRAGLVGAGWIRPGAAVIDVGINRTPEGLRGDVDFEAAREVAGWITPVPGGVGPMTIAMLLRNVACAARLQAEATP